MKPLRLPKSVEMDSGLVSQARIGDTLWVENDQLEWVRVRDGISRWDKIHFCKRGLEVVRVVE